MSKIGRPTKDYTGLVIGKLTLLYRVKCTTKGAHWEARCECGNTLKVRVTRLVREGSPYSCGCSHPLLKHGMSHEPTYNSWQCMKSRCTNPKAKGYDNYGGRGIKVCKRWFDSFENFLADMGERPRGMTLERVDNSRGYSPDNCKWASKKEQANNRRKRKTTGVRHLRITENVSVCG